jgi:hypothetical protein
MASHRQDVILSPGTTIGTAQSAVANILAPKTATGEPWYLRPGPKKSIILTPFPLRVNVVFSPKPGENDISVVKNGEKLEWKKKVWYVSVNTHRVPKQAPRNQSPFLFTLRGRPEEKINQTLLRISL